MAIISINGKNKFDELIFFIYHLDNREYSTDVRLK